jgi:hypothetical protein
MSDNLEFVFNLTNKMSPQLEKIMGEVQLLAKNTDKFKNVKIKFNDTGIDRFNNKLKATKGTMQYYRETLQRLEAGRDKVWRTDQIERYNRMIDRVRGNIKRMDMMHGNKPATAKGGGMFGGFGNLIGAGMAFGTARQMFNFGQQAALTGARYEKYQAVLENTLGSRDMARSRMDQLKNLSAKTPFQISDWVESDIKLQNRGQNLDTSQMTNLGDLAASQGKGVDQLVEAMLDAQQMEFERLKEFGIKASKEGDKVTLNFKNQKIQVAATADAMTEAILNMGKYKGVAGGMAKVSKTTEGQISNLKDSFEQMMAAIGESSSGPVKNLLAGLTGITGTVKKWFEIPTSQKLREEKSEMNALVSIAQDYTKTSDERNAALQQLQSTYPEYFANLTEEDVRLGKLKQTLDGINASYGQKIKLAAAKEVRQANLDAKVEAESERLRLEMVKQLLSQGDEASLKMAEKYLSSWESLKIGLARLNPISGMLVNSDNVISEIESKLDGINKEITDREKTEFKNAQTEKLATFDVFADKYLNKYDQLTEKLNKKDKEKFKALYDEYVGAVGMKMGGGTIAKQRGLSKAMRLANEMDAILNPGKKTDNTLISAGSGLQSKSDAIIGGGSKPVNINVTINELKGIENLTTNSTVKETAASIEDAVLETMIRAINGAVLMTGNNMR